MKSMLRAKRMMVIAYPQREPHPPVRHAVQPDILANVTLDAGGETIQAALWAEGLEMANGKGSADICMGLKRMDRLVGNAVSEQQVAIDTQCGGGQRLLRRPDTAEPALCDVHQRLIDGQPKIA